MPTYEYKCANCGHYFETFQSIKDDPVRTCPQCGEDTVQRLISSGTGLIFKGSGFYLTDYKHQSGSKSTTNGKTGTQKPSTEKKPKQQDSKS
ncbi:MAG: zinc ribbon domain-containing protein [Candidatus Neomarinimicrobiota bacterium]|nr:MAG: zinc ribbon domain-containing protein [Candidatus Neomarinimicrobiota bacterium]